MKKILFLTTIIASWLLPTFVMAQVNVTLKPAHSLDNALEPKQQTYTIGNPTITLTNDTKVTCKYTMEAFQNKVQIPMTPVSNTINTFATTWADKPGKVSVKVTEDASNNAGCPKGKDFGMVIQSVTGLSPNIMNCKDLVIGRKVTHQLVANLAYKNDFNKGTLDIFTECKEYEWKLKANTGKDWNITTSDIGGIKNKVCDVETDESNAGTMMVRGKSQFDTWSDWAECDIKRFVEAPCPIVGAPSYVICEDTKQIAVSGTEVQGVVGYTYEWKLPNGWSGSTGGINTTITPSGVNGGELLLVAKAFGKTSSPCSKTISLEVISPTTKVIGSEFLCVGIPQQYSLTEQNLLPASSATTWAVTPSSAVKVSSGIGATAILNSSGTYNGYATLTFTVKNKCGEVTRAITFFMGEPIKPVIVAPECFASGNTVNLFVSSPGSERYEWVLPLCDQKYNDPINDPFPYDCWVNMKPKLTQSSQANIYVGKTGGYVSVFSSNVCGTTSSLLRVVYCEGDEGSSTGPWFPLIWNGGSYGNVYPNPVDNYMNIGLNEKDFDSGVTKKVYITNLEGNGRQALESFDGNNATLDLSLLPSGNYILYIEAKERTVFSQFLKQ